MNQEPATERHKKGENSLGFENKRIAELFGLGPQQRWRNNSHLGTALGLKNVFYNSLEITPCVEKYQQPVSDPAM